ncbi:hypothetical protein ONZ43_g1831 [Nemania bipapillata]|uniref:Uncharacterized protein n=1 Tax=Nemania bipapillata TaxID=110536 RepID=A0ACC2J340_9PEZI|nr:hypothetical protein ONZ43_g1831 [Nemania bipapillata]
MLFSSLAFAASSLAFVVQGIPATGPSDLDVLHEYTSRDGVSNITIYGRSTQPDTSPLEAVTDLNQKRSCDGTVVCDNHHTADRAACGHLIDDLRGDKAVLGQSPRAICGTYGGEVCCVSWHKVVSGATRDSLVYAAQKAYDACWGDTGISAKVHSTLIGQTCTDQCMSNRATHC